LKQTGTLRFLRWLDSQIEQQISLIENLSGEYEDKTNNKLQRFAMRLKTLRTIKKAAYDPQTITGASSGDN
jgi:flagellar biosynthesis chaperone FliJ